MVKSFNLGLGILNFDLHDRNTKFSEAKIYLNLDCLASGPGKK